ncbi:MAG TPA: SH3 domain-containing protein [Opitutaceae bacterium]
MKINRLGLAAVFAAAFSTVSAVPLTQTAAVHAKPSATAPVVSVLNAGAEPVTATGTDAPAGWMAVELSGPHELYVQNKDIQKNLEVKPGASMHKEPKTDSPAVATAVAGDPTEITGLRGRWTQIRLNKPLIGYIQVGGASTSPTPATPPPAHTPAVQSTPPPPATAPATNTGQPAPMVNSGDGGISALPRLFQGKLTSTRHPLRPRRPYEYQLVDDGGDRYAYVDITKLLQTEQIDKYVDRTVVVYGTAKPVAGTKDIVIQVESLQLR